MEKNVHFNFERINFLQSKKLLKKNAAIFAKNGKSGIFHFNKFVS